MKETQFESHFSFCFGSKVLRYSNKTLTRRHFGKVISLKHLLVNHANDLGGLYTAYSSAASISVSGSVRDSQR